MAELAKGSGREESALWGARDGAVWRAALERYVLVVAAQGIDRLGELDRWYHDDLPALIRERRPPYVTRAELVRTTEWKMARGVWRARNLVLVRSNSDTEVETASEEALALVPHPTAPVARLAKLAGVGPATASAILAAARPELYPFFDELVAAQVPGLGPVKFTLGFYAAYAEAIRRRAQELEAAGARADASAPPTWWTPAAVERALWASSGGKQAHS